MRRRPSAARRAVRAGPLSAVELFTEGRPFHHFKLDPVASSDWLNGDRFEEIIGTRRFTVKRVPDLYLPDLLRLLNTVF